MKKKYSLKTLLGYLEGWISVIINTGLFGLKYWIGVRLNSVAIIADAFHTLSDTLTSIIVIVGFWISAKKADKNHPFGHGRAEIIAAIIIATLLAVVGFGFLKESINRLMNFQSVKFSIAAVIIFSISVVLKEALSRFSIWAGRKIDSLALIADAWHHRSDAIASLLILIGALLGKNFWWMDGILGILVSLLILYAGYDIFKDSINTLLGEAPEKSLNTSIGKIIKDVAPEVESHHHLHLHKYGDHRELTIHVKMADKTELKSAHRIATKIEKAIKSKLNIEATIHVESIT